MSVNLFEAMVACAKESPLWYQDDKKVIRHELIVAADETGVMFAGGTRRSLRDIYESEAEALHAVTA